MDKSQFNTVPSPALLRQLKRHEGFSKTPYLCPAGAVTIGYGTNLDAHPNYLPTEIRENFKSWKDARERLRILYKAGLFWSEGRAEWALEQEVHQCHRELLRLCPVYHGLLNAGDVCRADVLINMAFNMGVAGLLSFRKTLTAISTALHGDKNYNHAADMMIRSKWYRQVGRRASELVEQMRTGMYKEIY